MHLLLDGLGSAFFVRALLGGTLIALTCGLVGAWVVVRGMAFLGEAIGHGMLPGVALATLAGVPPVVGGAAAATAMSALIATLQRRGKLSYDTSIGLLFVAMLAGGVIIVSHSGSFATDVTALMFGDILAITRATLWLLAVVALITMCAVWAGHRAFIALAFDRRIASTLGYRPRLAGAALIGLVTLAVVASAQAVGTLLVVALLLGPAVAAQPWSSSLIRRMLLGAAIGAAAVTTGLYVSWFAATAAGASIAASAIAAAALSHAARALHRSRRGPSAPPTLSPVSRESLK